MAMTLHKLSVYTMDPMFKLKLLAVIVKECDKKIKGGSLLSVVYSHLHHGNKILSGTVRKLLTSMCKPIYSTLVRWILGMYYLLTLQLIYFSVKSVTGLDFINL